MRYSQMLILVRETGLSPERAAPYFGLSGMTLRRWQENPLRGDLPEPYASACAKAVHRLVAEGVVSPESAVVGEILKESGEELQKSVEKTLGLAPNFLAEAANNSDVLESGLSRIGSDSQRRDAVERQKTRIFSFASWGKGWKRCISKLMEVIRSPELTLADKLVAYGALFYLITPFDLIPDTIPGIGYLDDFAILSLALLYYERRYRKKKISTEMK
ncbi:MAG TPA: YkvA family protein [Elusimicrobiota bacterium]|nr:YkvA family protein [Elusimicrobiota bacterium]